MAHNSEGSGASSGTSLLWASGKSRTSSWGWAVLGRTFVMNQQRGIGGSGSFLGHLVPSNLWDSRKAPPPKGFRFSQQPHPVDHVSSTRPSRKHSTSNHSDSCGVWCRHHSLQTNVRQSMIYVYNNKGVKLHRRAASDGTVFTATEQESKRLSGTRQDQRYAEF